MTSTPLARSQSTEPLAPSKDANTSQSRGLFARASPLQNLTFWFSDKERKLNRRSSKRASSLVSEAPPTTAAVNEVAQQDTTLATTPEAVNGDVIIESVAEPNEAIEVLQQNDTETTPTVDKAPVSPTRLDTLSNKAQELPVAQKEITKQDSTCVATVDAVSTLGLAALHNAIAGARFADLELVAGNGNSKTLVHSAVLAKAAPEVLAEIRNTHALFLDSMEYSGFVPPPKSTTSSVKLPATSRSRTHSHAAFPSSDADSHSPARRLSKVVSAGVRRARTFSVVDAAARPVVAPPPPAPIPEAVLPSVSDDAPGISKVQVKGVSASSLRAFIFYLYTSHLNFVSWTRSTRTIVEEVSGDADAIELATTDGFAHLSATPPPFDALAAYSLGETLKMEDMATKALAFIIVNLQPDTALPLLLSPQAERFAQLRLSILEYVATTWDEVKVAPGTQAVLKKLARGDYPYSSTALLSLLLDLDSHHHHHKGESK